MKPAHEPRLPRVAAMVADPARSRMLAYLMSGEYASAGELAKVASVAQAGQSASRQLANTSCCRCCRLPEMHSQSERHWCTPSSAPAARMEG